jgi:hypothetical protein
MNDGAFVLPRRRLLLDLETHVKINNLARRPVHLAPDGVVPRELL